MIRFADIVWYEAARMHLTSYIDSFISIYCFQADQIHLRRIYHLYVYTNNTCSVTHPFKRHSTYASAHCTGYLAHCLCTPPLIFVKVHMITGYSTVYSKLAELYIYRDGWWMYRHIIERSNDAAKLWVALMDTCSIPYICIILPLSRCRLSDIYIRGVVLGGHPCC